MSLKFAIIPISHKFDYIAYDIKSKLLDSIKLPLTIEVDLDYSKSHDSKILKWTKKKYDVIIIGAGHAGCEDIGGDDGEELVGEKVSV